MDLTGKQRKELTKLGHDLSPVVYIGKNGLTDETTGALDKALNDHELVKLRFVEWKKSREEIARRIAKRTDAVLVRVIGNTALIYRQHPDPDKRDIHLP